MTDLLTSPFIEQLRRQQAGRPEAVANQRIKTMDEQVLDTLLHGSTLALTPEDVVDGLIQREIRLPPL